MKLINKNANTRLYFDMDGTIADFNGQTDAVKRFRSEKGFFKNLKPLEKNLQAVKRAIADGYDCYIITASPHRRADNDKIKWLIKYLPEMPTEKVIITRLGECKAHAMKTVDGILFDDYDRNCKEWVTYNNKNRAVQIKADGQILDGIRAINVWTERLINCEIKG